LSVIEYLKDKEQNELDEYINKFKIPKRFTAKDIQDKTRSFESEQIDFKIEDIIGDDVPEINHPPVVDPLTTPELPEVKAEVVAEVVKTEEPKTEEPKAEEPKAEEPKAEEPKAEEPKAEEPKAVGTDSESSDETKA
jgi:hypothetical protein